MRRERPATAQKKKNKDSMNKLIFVVAALAAGLTAPVQSAWSQTAAAQIVSPQSHRATWRDAPTSEPASAPTSTVQKEESANKQPPAVAPISRSSRGAWKAAPVSKAKQQAKIGVDRTTTSSIAAGPARAGGSPYDAIIARHAAKHGVPLSLARAVVRVESNFRANARGRAGEIGLMQIKPATARGMGYSGSAKGLYDPETNIRYGMKYLAGAHRLGGGDTCGTILRYNAGHGAKRMNKISAAYCAKVKRHMAGA